MNTITPISTEARGRLRQWKRQTLARYERIMQIYASGAFQSASADFRWKATKGQQRALARLRRMMSEARFEQARTSNPVHVLWAFLRPRASVIHPDADTAPGRLQDCTTVDYVVVGDLYHPSGKSFDGHATGFWHCEFQDHSVARLLQRSPACDIDAVLWEAHRNALDIRFARLGGSILIPAGRGAFVAELLTGHDLDTGDEHMVHIQTRTWVDRDQLYDKQQPVRTSRQLGERLGDNLLLPLPLRHLFTVAAEIEAEIEKTG